MTDVLITAIVIAAIIIFGLLYKIHEHRQQLTDLWSEFRSTKEKYENDKKAFAEDKTSMQAEINRLAPFREIADADAKSQELLQAAQTALDKANSDATTIGQTAAESAKQLVDGAKSEASTIRSLAQSKAKQINEQAEARLNSATIEAGKMVENAHKRAEEIAGSAYEAMNNAKLYEQTVIAMKNKIEGYGNQYLIPEHSLLDDLAEDVAYAEAGQMLKVARELSNRMVGNNTAADCDYVEANRRDIAIKFVIDAFNGKVDSILSRAKHDNAGTLKQEIQDAFTLVNYNGKAFRSARILTGYLTARLEELKWAAVAQQIKLDEREQQRRIKEQLREEEKARREYERALRDTAKEEELIRKAMEKAQHQIEKAGEEQRAKFEEQLRELQEKLIIAEERNKRALSMAQQTRRGNVYIISNIGSFGENVYKIGLTRRLEPMDRIRELGDSSVPFDFDVHALIFSEDAPALETQLHKHFVISQMNKVNHRKEFFRVGLKEIRQEIEKLGISASWTMTAQAREYFESLAIDSAIKEDPAKREAWVKRQLELEVIETPQMEPIGTAVED